MNETLKAMRERRSTRKFKPDAVPRELIEQVVDAGLWAPSGMNRQSTIIVAVTNKELRDRLSAANRAIGGWPEDFDPFYGAPVVLVVLARTDAPTYLYDGSLAMGNMLLAAHTLGLGSCWIHRAKEEFASDEFKALLAELGVEGEYEGIGHCILGYIDAETPAQPRKDGRAFWVE